MNIDVDLNVDQLLRKLDDARRAVDDQTMDALEAGGETLRDEFAAGDSRHLAHDSWTVERRDSDREVAVGPAKGRAHIVRFHEFGTRFLPAKPVMRPAVDTSLRRVTDAVAKVIKRAVER